MKRWPMIALKNLLEPVERREIVVPEKKYRLLGVRWYGQGLFVKEEKLGLDVRASHLYRVQIGDFVYSRLFAWKGSFANATEAEHDCYVSNEFPCFHPTNRVDPSFLLWYFRRENAWNEVLGLSSGATPTSRNRLSEARFLEILVPLPTLDEQRAIVARLDAVAEKARQAAAKLDAIEEDADRLLVVRFRETIEGAPWRTMAEVAPLVRREVAINHETAYTELGVRGFYKGIFHRRTISGSEYTWQDLYWVKRGDLLFSNIMAWEQAIAVAGDKDNECVGNHRMLTCEANPEISTPWFIWYYFTTANGFAKILSASPGTAARNRTLRPDALMSIQVPVPPLAQQQAFNELQSKLAQMKAKHAEIRLSLNALLPSLLERLFKNA